MLHLVFMVLLALGCRTAARQSNDLSEVRTDGPYYRMWVGFRRMDLSADEFSASAEQMFKNMPTARVGAYVAGVASVAQMASNQMFQEAPDFVGLAKYESEAKYRESVNANANALNLAHLELFAAGKSKTPSAGGAQTLDDTAMSTLQIVADNDANWASGTTLILIGTQPKGRADAADFASQTLRYFGQAKGALQNNAPNGVVGFATPQYVVAFLNWSRKLPNPNDVDDLRMELSRLVNIVSLQTQSFVRGEQ